jgi:hypothetical protein
MTDEELAAVIVGRLNALLACGPEFELALGRVFAAEIALPTAVGNVVGEHPSLQVRVHANTEAMKLTALGVLNGLVGVIGEECEQKGWGYISARYREDASISEFFLTKAQPLDATQLLGRL